MPIYVYQHPDSKKIIEVVQSVHDPHQYIDEKGIKWNRVFTAPELNTQGSLDVNCTEKQFSEFTKNKRDKLGDLWDRSAELSEKRKKIYGEDPIKKKFESDWSKKRKGKKLPKSI